MTPQAKQIISIVAAAVVLVGGLAVAEKYRKTETPQPASQNQGETANWKTYENAEFAFKYPDKLGLKENNQQVLLSHSIPYSNHGACDMVGEEKTYPTLTDFDVSFEVINKSLVNSVRTMFPYIPEENFVGGNLKITPGYIDEYQLGTKKGISMYEGAEGCGHTVYYLPVNDNKTLFIDKTSVQALSPVITKEARDAVLKVPGVITHEDSDKYFNQILSSLKFLGSNDVTANWKTYRNDEFGFEVRYPNDWFINTKVGGTTVLVFNSPKNQNVWDEIKAGKLYAEGYADSITIQHFKTTSEFWSKAANFDDLDKTFRAESYASGWESTIFAGHRAYTFDEPGVSVYYTVLIEKDGQLYEIMFGNKSKSGLDDADNHILSSFKFIK